MTQPLESSTDESLDSGNWLNRLKTVFSIDLRSLALMRILMALLILADLLLRLPTMQLFYTDAGAPD